MTPQRLAEIRARLTGPRHPLDLGYLYAQDVGELLEEVLCARINADEARSLLATAEQEMERRVADAREACARVAEKHAELPDPDHDYCAIDACHGIAKAIRDRK